ncbi:MAG: hypothetical protein M0006_11105 [Magnetospirillum sp.]|nr:hypothetical protein [Magnetospirillum sp.]
MAALGLMALGACDTLPQPFRHDGRPPELARPQDVRAVAVLPLDGGTRARALADAVVKAFEKRDIPATVDYGSPSDLVLESWLDDTGGRLGIEWRLRGPDRRPRASYRQDIPGEIWTSGSAKDIAALADQAVAALADGQQASSHAPAPPTPHRTTVRLKPLAGLPGDGDTALARALRNAIERRGLLVVGEGGDYIVEGRIGVVPGKPGEDLLKVAWTVSRPDGKSLGTIDQQGAVPKGSLEQPWGKLARDIADGGAEGIEQVVAAAPGSTLQNK